MPRPKMRAKMPGFLADRDQATAVDELQEHRAGSTKSLRVGVLGEAPLTLEDQPVVLGDADGR